MSKESIRAIPFGDSKHPLPTRSLRLLRAAAAATSSTLYLHFARHLVSAAEKRPVSCREAEGLVTELWSPRSVTMQWLCFYVTAANQAFSRCGLEAGLPAFQLPMCGKCDTLPKRDLFDKFVSGIHSCQSFLEYQASTPCQKLQVPESGSRLHQLYIMLALCLQKITCLCRRFWICVSCREA